MTLAINPKDLVCMDDVAGRYHFRVELAYARDDNLLFGERIYRENARLWLYRELAEIVCEAANSCYETHGLRFILYDGLRTIEAQEAMMRTRRALDNPHWTESPRLLSTPGIGGHPRGMAIDIGLEDESGNLIDMGCPFDFLAKSPHPEHNPAHRKSEHSRKIKQNRAILDNAMVKASENLETPIMLLAEEWWDFRLLPEFYKVHAPISEIALPENMKMMG